MDTPPRHAPQLPEDDGRTVAPMDIDGMPWRRAAVPPGGQPGEPLKGKAFWRYMFGAVGAGLLVVFLYGGLAAAFIWFCTAVWFR